MNNTRTTAVTLSGRQIERLHDINYTFLGVGLASGLLTSYAITLEEARELQLIVKIAAFFCVFISMFALKRQNGSGCYQVLLPVMLLTALAGISTWLNDAPPLGFLRWLAILVYFWVVARMSWGGRSGKDPSLSFLLGLVLAGGAFSVYALRFSTYIRVDMPTFRRAVESVHPNAQGMVCGGTGAAAVAFLFLCQNKKLRGLLWVVFVLAFWAMIITGSRTSIVACLAGIACLWVLRYGYRATLGELAAWSLAAVVAVIGISFLWGHYASFLSELIRYDSLFTAAGRTEAWAYILEEMLYPPIMPFGVGPGNGRLYLVNKIGMHAHSGCLQLVVDIGPLVVVPLALLFGVAARRALRALPEFPVEVAVFSSICLFTFVHALGEADLDRLGNSINLMFPVAVAKLWQARFWRTS